MRPPSRPSAPTPGPVELLGGRWEIRARMPGHMGTVFLLVDRTTGTRLAAKTPRVDAELDRGTVQRFAAEARNWLSLGSHANVVEAFYLEDMDYRGALRPFLFLEYVEGRTLGELVRAEGRLTQPVVLDVATGIAWGMAHAHGEGRPGPPLVHRDLKPDNVFLTRERLVKVSDFGIARALDRPEEAAAQGLGLGTPFYVAPEQMRDARLADRRSDIYSYGAVLYELLVGTPPFPAKDLSELVFRVLRDEPEPISVTRPQVDPALEALVRRCLSKQPAERPDSFGEILRTVSEIREQAALWAMQPGTRSCAACGWLSARRSPACPLCTEPLGDADHYAPVAPRAPGGTPTLGRTDRSGRLRIAGIEFRPRVPRAGEQVVATALLENDGGGPVEDVVLPHVRPDRDAFSFGAGAGRGSFRGTVAPTGPGAPLRVSWTLVPLRAGRFRLRGARAFFRDEEGRRHSVRSRPVVLDVVDNDVLPLVGRQEERDALQSCVGAAAQGDPTFVLVTAAPGLGKSRLTREAWNDARSHGFLRARGRCLDRGTEVRGALKEALRQLLRIEGDGGGPGQPAASLLELLGEAGHAEPGLLPFLVDELLGRRLARGMSPAHMWARFAVVLARRKPLMLVLEDVQRDPEVAAIAFGSVQLARRHRAQLLVVVTARPELEQGPAADLVRLVERDAATTPATQVLRLGPLADQDVKDVLAAEFEPNDFDRTAPWLLGEIASLSGANPLFLVELVRTLKSGGAAARDLVVAEDGRWTAGPRLDEERLRDLAPDRVGATVSARVEEMSPPVRRFVQAAAVLGDVFELDLLSELLGEPADFADSLRSLEQGGLLREYRGPPAIVRFREPIVPEIVARELAAQDADAFAKLHSDAADLLSRRPGARGPNALRLGRHLFSAGRRAQGVPVLVDAARRLVERQSYQRAAMVLAEAEAGAAEDAVLPYFVEVELHLLRGEALRFTGDFPGALAAYDQLVGGGLAARSGEATLALVHSKMGKVHETLGQFDEALYCYAVGLALRQEHGATSDVPMSLANLAGVHLLRGELERARDYHQRASAAARASDSAKARGRVHVIGAQIAVVEGNTQDARPLVRAALSEARRAADRRGSSLARQLLSLVNLREGRAARAVLHARRALRIRQEMGDRAAIASTWSLLGRAHESRGELSEALESHRRAADLARRIGLRRALVTALAGTAHVSLLLGRPRRAGEALVEALEDGGEAAEPSERAVLLVIQATYLRAIGEVEEAAEVLQTADRLAQESSNQEAGGRIALAHARHARAGGDREATLAHARRGLALNGLSPDLEVMLLALAAEMSGDGEVARRALERAAHAEDPRVLAAAQAADARVALSHDEPERAASLLRRAAGAAVQCGQRDPFVLRMLRDQARALGRADPAAAAAAQRRADEMAEELQARGYSTIPE